MSKGAAPSVDIKIDRDGDTTRIRYTTPKGSLSTATVYTDEMRNAGTSIPWVSEHLIKGREDYQVAASLFELMDVVPTYEVASTARKAGKGAGILLPSPDLAAKMSELGFNFIAAGSDGGFVVQGMRNSQAVMSQLK